MDINVGRIVSALVEAELTAEKGEANRYQPRGNVVTIAHELGSRGRAVGKSLARYLGVEYYDREILDAIVAAVPEDRALMERLDEQVASAWTEFLHQVLAGKSALDEYRRHLIGMVLAIGRRSGVIMGRGAHLILSQYKVFRVRIVGSPEVCARRLMEQEHGHPEARMSWEQALERVMEARQKDAQFIHQQFNKSLDDSVLFDLVINTDHIPVEAAANIIVEAMRSTGFAVDRKPGRHPAVESAPLEWRAASSL